MEIYSSFWHILISLLIFIFGGVTAVFVSEHFGLTLFRSLVIYFWHTLFCMVYLWYMVNFGGDAIGYFLAAQNKNLNFDFGTSAIDFLSAIFVQGLGLSLLGAFLLFNIFGVIGLIAFDGSLKVATRGKPVWIGWLATLIVFLPSVSFWSSSLGKDSLAFLATGLALWAALDFGRRVFFVIAAILVMLIVRPHVAGMMLIALSISLLFDKNSSWLKKFLFGAFAVAVSIILIPFALNYVGFGSELDVHALNDYIEKRQSYNMEGGGAVDISSMSLPMQIYTYMFRPMIFEVNSVFSLAAAIDNLILIFLFVAGFLALRAGARSNLGENRAFMWSYSLIAWFFLAVTTANLGISLRQKWMFAPMLIFLLISVLDARKIESDADLNQ